MKQYSCLAVFGCLLLATPAFSADPVACKEASGGGTKRCPVPISATNIPWYVDDFGDGSSGAHSCTGSETLSANMNYTTWTGSASCVVDTASYDLAANGTFTCAAGCIIKCNGNNGGAGGGATGTAGAARADGHYTGSAAGGAGSNGGGAAGGNLTNTFSAAGGAGGDGANASGGAGGTVSKPKTLFALPMWIYGVGIAGRATDNFQTSLIALSPGAGGGGGGGTGGAVSGGGGGSGGCTVAVRARHLSMAGTAQANGGNGGNGNSSGGGGGGGGSGGRVNLYSPDLTVTGTVQANGGTGGTAGSGAVAGSVGGAGIIKLITPS